MGLEETNPRRPHFIVTGEGAETGTGDWFYYDGNTGETLKSISAGHPVSIQHPYEELAKYILGFPGMLNL